MAESRVFAQQLFLVVNIISCVVILEVSCSAFRSLHDLKNLDLLNALESDYNQDKGLEDSLIADENSKDKRYARLSYNYQGTKGGSGNSRYYKNRYYENYYAPWKNLPDTDCYRSKCSDDKDCCKKFSKCDMSAHVCYDCWYGHPCRTSRDCCINYPNCNKISNLCQA